MKRVLCLFLCLTMAFSCFGCGEMKADISQALENVNKEVERRQAESEAMVKTDLVKVADCPEGSYYMEPVTGVMYLWVGFGYKGGLSVMYDANGLPLTYTRFLDLYDYWRK